MSIYGAKDFNPDFNELLKAVDAIILVLESEETLVSSLNNFYKIGKGLIEKYNPKIMPFISIYNSINKYLDVVKLPRLGSFFEKLKTFDRTEYIKNFKNIYRDLSQWLKVKKYPECDNLERISFGTYSKEEWDSILQMQSEFTPPLIAPKIVKLGGPELQWKRDDIYKKKERYFHWGQRKLLMTEIEFYTMFAKKGSTVIYIGSAPGDHAGLVSEMFPELNFVVVDITPFKVDKMNSRIRLINSLMTDELAKELKKEYEDILFVSDIRRDASAEEMICEDLIDQGRWYDILEARAGMFKFRLLWTPGTFKYFKGIIFMQPWTSSRSFETRLITNTHERIPYDNMQYMKNITYFNTIVKRATYDEKYQITGVGYPQGTWDTAREIDILREYVKKKRGKTDEKEVDVMVGAIAKLITVRFKKSMDAKEWLARMGNYSKKNSQYNLYMPVIGEQKTLSNGAVMEYKKVKRSDGSVSGRWTFVKKSAKSSKKTSGKSSRKSSGKRMSKHTRKSAKKQSGGKLSMKKAKSMLEII